MQTKMGQVIRIPTESLIPLDWFQLGMNCSIDILELLGHLNAVFKQATFISIPNFKVDLTVKEMKNIPWSKNSQRKEKQTSVIKACNLA